MRRNGIGNLLAMTFAYLLGGAGTVFGVWLGLDIALGGEIAKGVGIGLAILFGSNILATIIAFLAIALLDD